MFELQESGTAIPRRRLHATEVAILELSNRATFDSIACQGGRQTTSLPLATLYLYMKNGWVLRDRLARRANNIFRLFDALLLHRSAIAGKIPWRSWHPSESFDHDVRDHSMRNELWSLATLCLGNVNFGV